MADLRSPQSTPRRYSGLLHHWMLPLAALVLICCLQLTSSAEADGDLVFDDVTSNPSPLWRKFPMQQQHYRRYVTPIRKEAAAVEDNSFFSPVRLVKKLSDGYKRVKRGLFDFLLPFAPEVKNNSPDLKETEPVTDLTPAGNTLTTLSRETRSTESDDDEDLEGNSGVSSGMTGENTQDSDEITRGERIRATLRVREPYEKEFKDVNSERFKEITRKLSEAIQEVYKDFPGQKDVNVVSITNTTDVFEISVIVDMDFADSYNSARIQRRLREAVSKNALGDFTVSNDVTTRNFAVPPEPEDSCLPGEIMCVTKEHGRACLPSEVRCNGIEECADGYDEQNCFTATPPVTSGSTLHSPDADNTSSSHLDETHAGRPNAKLCRSDDQVVCEGSSVTICGDQLCDGQRDCPDGFDERNCCAPKEFSCDVSRCIPFTSRCDGRRDCADGLDERDCPEGSHVCPEGQFMCTSGHCISVMTRCDQKVDCPEDEADEEGCPCSSRAWQCNDGSCISIHLKCDGKRDCPNGDDSDERNCPHCPYKCRNGHCIDEKLWCNGYVDCYDGSDEKHCTCQENSFRCNNGVCIRKQLHCDGMMHCNDGSDEANCNNTRECRPDEFQCHSSSAQNPVCIDATLRCDHASDCEDGSDERNCTAHIACTGDSFRCGDNSCIHGSLVCNGERNCNDGSDEDNCDDDLAPCPSSDFSCEDGYCIPLSQKCDGQTDCASGIDEADCPDVPPTDENYVACLPDEFRCNNGDCIYKYLLCDQINDCIDKSDETNCPTPDITQPPTCAPSEFTCFNGQCVRASAHCDGVFDCMDQSDEHNCIRSCNFNEFRCRNGLCIPSSYVCDRHQDCSDNSDETNCTKECRPDEFQCSNGQCIPRYRYCDRSPDCLDGSDEVNCPRPPQPVSCSWNQFACSSGDQCVPKSTQCDNIRNCNDGSDEFNCANNVLEELNLKTYPDDQKIKESRDVVFQCRDEGPLRAHVRWAKGNGLPLPPSSTDINGRLEIHNIQISDGGNYICEAIGYPPSTPGARVSVILQVEPFPQPVTRPPQACALDEATCSNGDCIKKHMVCNGRYECTDGSDEMRCNPLGCEPNQFTCDNRKCVQKTWMCDSDNDCGDWSDERNCGTTSPGSRCKYNEFECAKANQCIPKSFHCDMEVDCQDQSDEIGCSAVTQDLSVPLPPLVAVDQGGTFTAHCRMIGVPTPVVVWRKNWGHIPSKCVTTTENGYGTITCPDIQDSDQGAYSCEGLNSRGSTFANPDTYLLMNKPNTTSSTCPVGQFNNLAARPEECISCFCFGATSDCSSANLFVYQFPPPVDHHELLDVYFHPDGSVNINDHSSVQSSLRSNRQRNGFQILSFPTDSTNYYENYYPYYVMPDNDEHGSYLKSYGGYLSYSVLFNGKGQPVDHIPDVILKGNGYILVHRGQPLSPGREHKQSIRLFRGEWYKVKDPKTGPGATVPQGGVLATREDIMMTMVNVENILIKAQYLSGPGIETTISNIHMDSAGISNVGLGQAAFVEECRCPIGYSGLSCEQCAPGFMRHSSGPWLGHCKSIQEACRPGTYGDPSRNIPCEPCPCPLTNPSNQFGRTCYLDSDGQPTCNCEPGYQGRRCEQCARGYSGNPFVPGDYCKREFCDPAGSISQDLDQYGQCRCKDFTTGPQCNHCKANTFHLSSIHKKGCISCFCMGITQECTSLKWYRNQITSAFSTSTQDFKLAESSEPTKEIAEGLYVDRENGELIYRDFTKPDVYYWVLPARFLGDRISSYGGYLNYTIRYVPTPGGQSSRNNAPDVELISANHFRLRYYNNDNPVEPNKPVTISVPIMEHKWQREDGKTAERENFLMALADLNAILIKATYTTNTQSASLITVSLDTADERNTNQPRTSEVELCTCPPGYKGFSCEDCDTGYTRTDNGLYLGICEECKCNGHSSQCDPDNGKCYNCRDHTEGDFCERCQPGYRGNPQRGEPCLRDDESYQCTCDERGSLSRECRGNECVNCKRNVEGPRCDTCRRGTFDLSADHPEGCLECFCSSVSDDCQSANLYITQIPMLIIDNNHGFTLTDSNREDIISDGFKLIPQKNEIGFNLQNQQRSRLFWSLPREFTGNKVTSYGGNLTFSQRFNTLPKGKPTNDIDVQIVGNGISLFWRRDSDLPPDELTVQTIPLVPGDWRRLDRLQGQKVASREDIMTALSSIEAIIIRATHNTDVTWTFLSDVSLDTAVPQITGQKKATYIESCRCPAGYQGTSCESCSPGYYRDHENQCNKCPCNNNEESCSLGSGSRVVCHCKPSFTGTYCDSLAGLMVELMPMRVIAKPGTVVRFNCSYHSLEQLSITFEEAYCPLNYSEVLIDASNPFASRIYRYYWGSERILDLKIRPGHKMLTCKVRNRQGIEVGSLSSLINTETATPGTLTDSPPVLPQPTISISMGEPTYRLAKIGETVRMNCYGRSLTPDRVVSLKWSKHGGELPRGRSDDNMQGLLTISNIRPSDSGLYICTASDGYSFVTEQATLFVEDTQRNVAPKVTVTPAYLSVREGDPVEFRCLATGTPTPVSQWIGQGGMNRQASFSGGLFYINSARKEDEGTYECTATNFAGSDAKRVVLKVESTRIPIDNASSILSVEPKEFIGSVGETVELQCLPLMVDYTTHWNRSGQPLPSAAQDREGVLTIYNAKPSDSGIYICYGVSSSNGHRVQTQTRVSVENRRTPPKVMIEPESQTILQGMSGEIRCLATGDPPPSVTWSKQQERDYFPPNVQVVGNILRISSARVQDRGLYVCLAENSAGSSRGGARVEVEPREPPQAIIYPQEYNTVIEGGSVMVQCRVTAGIPTPRLHWSRADGRPLPVGSELPGGALRLIRVSMQDEGRYLCNVSNDVGSVTAVASVEVQSLPVIHMNPPGPLLTVRLGQSVRIECRATGHPPPSVNWSPPHIMGGLRGLSSDPGGPTYEIRKEVAVYEINQVQARDEGIYTCKAQNAAGPAEEEIQLMISNDLDPGPTRGDVPSALHPLTQGVEGKVELDETNFRLPTGARAHIRCVARGNDNVYLKWVKDNGLPLPPDFITRDGVLYLNNVQREDAGFYTCLGLSPGDNSVLFTATASLKVIEIPRITLDPERQFKKPGESAQIRCIAHGDQPINISWAAVGRNLPPSVSYDRGYLTFSSIVPDDAGHYICRARNPYGDAEAVAEVIVNNRTNYTRPVVTAADRNPVAPEGTDITLKCDSEPDTNITWSRHQSSLPPTARLIGNALYISYLRQEDSGRYICDARSPSGIKSSDYINLYVTQRKCGPRQFRCNTGFCITETAVCDGYPHCSDRSDERDCNYRPGRGANDVKLRIEPNKDVVSIGDNVELHCVASGSPKTEIYWTNLGDTPSANVQDDQDVVRITSALLSNRGLYKCKAPSATGHVEAEYILNVLDPPNTPRPSSEEREAQKRSASYGDMVVLDCDAQLLPPVVFSWTKEGGEIQPNTNTRQGRLVIPYATSADAGLYVCSAQSGDTRINIPTILTVTRAVPFFSQAPVSYIAVPTLRDANLEFEIEISFKPEQYDGLILYNSQSRDGSGDFVSFGMKNGLLEFRFDVGSGLAVIRNDRPIQLSQWHTVQLHRVRKEGKMYVDGKGPFTGLGAGAFVQLDLLEPLFLGGVPSFANINKQAGLSSGFVGCISRLVIGQKEVDIIKETLTKEGVTDCETCAVNPCENNGVCQEAQTKQGYRCICPRGFRGENCSYVGDPCYEGACGSGKCVSSGSGLKCLCPLNKAGDRCERSISIVEPAFSGESYLAYPSPKANHKLKIALKINPSEVSDSLLLYSAQNEQGTGDFVSLSIKDRHVEFRFNSGQGPVILRSRHELKPGQWVTISAVRDHKEDGRQIHSKLSVDKEAHVSKSEPSRSHKPDLSLRTFVFVGGINKQGMKLAPDVGVENGFHGCISEVEVSGLDLDLLRSVMESSNVQECSDLHGDLCNLHPCQNNAVCRPTSHPPRYICDCQSGFSGVHCEHENNMCKLLTPCNNGAKCTGTSSSYYCDCPLGFSGPTCSTREEFTTEVSFRGNGYIELDKRLLPHTNPNEREIVTIEFSTDKPNSVLFWHGQSPDEDGRDPDFLSLAVVNGYLEMSWELGDGPGTIRSPKRVDDGMKHTVQMMRAAQSGSFSVDNMMKVQGDSPGSMTKLNTNGNIYIGGLPDIEKMTGRRYTEGLDGCIHLIQIQNSGVINLMDEAVGGINVGRCTRNDFDDYSNDIAAPLHTHIHRGDVQVH